MPEGSNISEIDAVLHQFFVERGLIDARDLGDLTAQTRLIDGGILNSLTLLKLVMFIEERFGLKLGPRDLGVDNFGTFGALVAFIEGRTQAAASDGS